jgi:hypothetical protein
MKIIELLDGSTWDKATVMEKMMEDSFYYGYLSKAALSSSACKLLLQSPKTYHYVTKYGQAESDAFAVGRLVHLMALEPHRVEEYDIIDVQSKNTNMWKEAKSRGGQIITKKEYNEARRIADALIRNEQVLGYIQGCKFEVPAIGMIDGIPFRAKADILDLPNRFMADLKTTREVRGFFHSAERYNYDVQAWLYTHIFNIPQSNFKFIAIDKESLDVGIFDVSPTFLNKGYKKVKDAIERYEIFFKHGESLDNYTLRGILE